MSPYLKLFMTAPLWASAFIAGQVVVSLMPPLAAAFFRFLIASVAMSAFLWRQHRRSLALSQQNNTISPIPLLPRTAQDWWVVLALGFVGVFVYNVLFMVGLQFVPGTRAATIIPTNPVFLVLIAWLFYREPLGGIRALGIGMAFMGAMLVVTKGHLATAFTAFTIHDGWLLGSIICWVFYVMASKPFLRRYGSLEMNTWSFVVGTVMLGLPLPWLISAEAVFLAFTHWQVWVGLAVMGFGASALAFIWYFEGMQAVGVIRAAVFISLIPVMAMLEAYLFLGQAIHLTDWLGAALVGMGIYAVNRTPKKSIHG
jgi:drug/metabolite transporter (DMT)-like permease